MIGCGRWLALLLFGSFSTIAIGAPTAIGGAPRVAPASHPVCESVLSGGPHPGHRSRPPQTVGRNARLVAVVETNCGRFEIKLDARQAPRIINSFVYLARSGFYDGLLFYRVVPEFIIQGGDPHNNGTGGPGYRVREPPPAGFHYRFGSVAMAKTDSEPSGTAGSTFFIVTGRGGRAIDDEYAILGQVHAGVATVKRIAALWTLSERPSQVVRIDSIRIERDGYR
jgi:cyclophilin family peptidyl-prolyl cis-trans isomerase